MKYFKLTKNNSEYWVTDSISNLLIELDLFKLDRPLRECYSTNEPIIYGNDSYFLQRFKVDNFTGVNFGYFGDKPEVKKEIVEVKKREYIPKIYKNTNSVRMAILSGDKHFCYEDKEAIKILEQICYDYSEFIDEFIDGGDGINNDALSRFVSTEDEKFTLYDEVVAFEKHLWKIKEILPKSKFVIVEDNHYHLRKKKFLAETPAMKGMLKEVDFPFDSQVAHGVPYFPFEQKRIGVIHGLSTNDNFTKAHSTLFKEDIINFHTHGSQHYTCKNGSKSLNKQAQKMWGMPSMCKQMDYLNGSPSRGNTGFGILWYDIESDMYDLQYVFIENGKAIYNGKVYQN